MKTFGLSVTLMAGLVVMATGWGQAESLSGMITTTHAYSGHRSRRRRDMYRLGQTLSRLWRAWHSATAAWAYDNGAGRRIVAHPGCLRGSRDSYQEASRRVDRGAGLVRRFREHGILVNSDHSAVRKVVSPAVSDWYRGLRRENRVEQTTVVRAALMGQASRGPSAAVTAGTACDTIRC